MTDEHRMLVDGLAMRSLAADSGGDGAAGDGLPVVLVHGTVARSRRAGTGTSPWPGRPTTSWRGSTPWGWIEPCSWGTDLGAGVVQRAAVARPGICAGLVLTNGVAYDAWLDVPARVVWGDADPFLSMDVARRLARDLGTVVRVIAGGRNFAPEDRPGPVAAAINELREPV